MARQPIPPSPYDDLRVEFHIEEAIAEGKLRQIDTDRQPLPEWSTPVFVVDQDAKGLLGRLVCSYGVLNSALEAPAFPSADPTSNAHEGVRGGGRAESPHGGRPIWGYT